MAQSILKGPHVLQKNAKCQLEITIRAVGRRQIGQGRIDLQVSGQICEKALGVSEHKAGAFARALRFVRFPAYGFRALPQLGRVSPAVAGLPGAGQQCPGAGNNILTKSLQIDVGFGSTLGEMREQIGLWKCQGRRPVVLSMMPRGQAAGEYLPDPFAIARGA